MPPSLLIAGTDECSKGLGRQGGGGEGAFQYTRAHGSKRGPLEMCATQKSTLGWGPTNPHCFGRFWNRRVSDRARRPNQPIETAHLQSQTYPITGGPRAPSPDAGRWAAGCEGGKVKFAPPTTNTGQKQNLQGSNLLWHQISVELNLCGTNIL